MSAVTEVNTKEYLWD